jgi:hypothetical protein
MMKLVSFGGIALIAGFITAGMAVSGCGSGSSSASDAAPAAAFPISRPGTAAGPVIAGSPASSVEAGRSYTFQPTVTNANGKLRFSVANLPAWARFDAATGAITGTPSSTQVGAYPGISISVTDATASAALPPFSIAVSDTNSHGNVVLSWEAPTGNSDGSPLRDLKGYKVHFGPSPRGYSDTIKVANPGLTTYVVDNLGAGTYFFAVTAYNSRGQESSLSAEISTTVVD